MNKIRLVIANILFWVAGVLARWARRVDNRPIQFFCREEIGVTIGNTKGLQKLNFETNNEKDY